MVLPFFVHISIVNLQFSLFHESIDSQVKAFIPFINLVGPIPAVRHFS
jgi:hypothetical protein